MKRIVFTLLLATAYGQYLGGPDQQQPQRGRVKAADKDYHLQRQLQAAQERKYMETYSYDDYDEDEAEERLIEAGSRGSSPNRYVPNPPKKNSLLSRRPDPDCRSKTRTLPHDKYCDLYYYTTNCDDGQHLLRSCPNGLMYTGSGRFGLMGVCDYPHNVDCGDRTNQNPPISTEHCDWLYGIFGHETSCTRYWTCWNGTATEQFCVGGLLYNEETHACDWPQNVLGCQKHPLCKDDANGNVPLGKSCNRYWACQGGYPRLQRCPAMLVFDKQRKRCISPPTADCDIPSTTISPEDLRDGSENRNRPRTGNKRRSQQHQQGNRGQQQQQQQQQQQFSLPEGATLLSRPSN